MREARKSKAEKQDGMIEVELRALEDRARGQEPRNAGVLWKLKKIRKQLFP